MTGLNENELHHFGSPKFSPFDCCVVCRLPSYPSVPERDVGGGRAAITVHHQEELRLPSVAEWDPEALLAPLLLQVITGGQYLCERRDCVMTKMARLTLAAGETSKHHGQPGEQRQYAGSTAAVFLPVAVLQVRKGANGGN